MSDLDDLEASRAEQARRIAALPVADRLRILDALCRDLTLIAQQARRVG